MRDLFETRGVVFVAHEKALNCFLQWFSMPPMLATWPHLMWPMQQVESLGSGTSKVGTFIQSKIVCKNIFCIF